MKEKMKINTSFDSKFCLEAIILIALDLFSLLFYELMFYMYAAQCTYPRSFFHPETFKIILRNLMLHSLERVI